MLAFAAIVWSQIFDWGIVEAANRYKFMQRQAADGQRPFVYVKNVMRPAIADSARRATVWSAPIGLVGLMAVRMARRQPKSAGRQA
jgi:hypothetical protein